MTATRFAVVSTALLQAVDAATASMRSISDADAARPLATGKWSSKQIIGHLIDSAANNHQRFVRAQEERELMCAAYTQDHWVRVQRYDDCTWDGLIALWASYNRHLAHVIANIAAKRATTMCTIGKNAPVTLAWLVDDYLAHLHHHLNQIVAGRIGV